MLQKTLCALLALLLAAAPARAMGRDELRGMWREFSSIRSESSPYAEVPDPETHAPGALTQAAQADALIMLNFLRAVAGLSPASLNPIYSLRAQNGALLLAVNDELDHHPPQPAGMDGALYESALMGTSLGNIAKFNWMRPEILIDGVTYFARDDGDLNLSELGHRRWLLNPHMAETGFGLANAESGMSYVCMYAVDGGNADAAWEYVSWPAAEAFPVELMRRELAWSVSLNDAVYDAENSRPRVLLREERSGAAFVFDLASGQGDGYCRFSREAYGSGSCIIFRPDIAAAGIEEYVQNQRWSVEISGLKTVQGGDAEIRYACDMVSLTPQDPVNVEVSPLEATLAPGETLQLRAAVIPDYADDLSVLWHSSDETVATVDASGLVRAVAPGRCDLVAASVNGRSDACALTVE